VTVSALIPTVYFSGQNEGATRLGSGYIKQACHIEESIMNAEAFMWKSGDICGIYSLFCGPTQLARAGKVPYFLT
jgi:hypothetical protein